MGVIKKLPVGIEDFEKICTEGFYYVDKTGLIKDLLQNWGEVNLFTRPRRFGKSLNMNMLKYFFEYGCKESLFHGLEIAKEQNLCDEYMGKFPVISISLKGVSGKTFESARAMLCSMIGNEAMRFQFLSKSDKLTQEQKKLYQQLIVVGKGMEDTFVMSDSVLSDSLLMLSRLLEKHYNQKVIILIDEYDVPLDKAQQFGYYDSMVHLIRTLFIQALKSNDSLYFAVLTGCLRISKESIFTGLNNPQIFSITDVQFAKYFGFTEPEVKDMLAYYGLTDKHSIIKEWYDGYQFGNENVYCPWDVINYCYALRFDKEAEPKDYWSNTSSNDIVRRFIDKAGKQTQDEIEKLIAGETITKEIRQELTYKDLDDSIENLWSILFTTGYLTKKGKVRGKEICLTIPNMEIREIFTEQIREWFRKTIKKDNHKLDAFCNAISKGDAETVEKLFNAYLMQTISIRDTSVRTAKKENFYHGILIGLLSHKENWSVFSNAESGEGYSDILVKNYDEGIGIVIEVKYAEKGALDTACQKAIGQVEKKGYEQALLEDGMQTILKYGIACYRKHCRVVKGREKI